MDEEVLGVFHGPAFHVAVPQPIPMLLVADPTFSWYLAVTDHPPVPLLTFPV